jgi:hypothetical protein
VKLTSGGRYICGTRRNARRIQQSGQIICDMFSRKLAYKNHLLSNKHLTKARNVLRLTGLSLCHDNSTPFQDSFELPQINVTITLSSQGASRDNGLFHGQLYDKRLVPGFKVVQSQVWSRNFLPLCWRRDRCQRIRTPQVPGCWCQRKLFRPVYILSWSWLLLRSWLL